MDKIINTREQGVTLLESMVALLVFLLASVGWLSLEANLAKTSGDTQVVARAVFIGQNKVDELRMADFDTLASSVDPEYYDENGNATDADAEGLVYSIEWAVTTPEDTPTKREVALTISWNLEGQIQNSIPMILTRSE